MSTLEGLPVPDAHPQGTIQPIAEGRPWNLRRANGRLEHTSPRALIELARAERLRFDDVIELANLPDPIPVVAIEELRRLIPNQQEHALQRAYRVLILIWLLVLLPLAGVSDLVAPPSVASTPDWRVLALFGAFALPMFVARRQLVRARNERLARDPLLSDTQRRSFEAVMRRPGVASLAIALFTAVLFVIDLALRTAPCRAALLATPIDLAKLIATLGPALTPDLQLKASGALLVLLLLGRLFENLFGPARFLQVTVLGGLAGLAASALLDPAGGLIIPATALALTAAFIAFAIRASDRHPVSTWQIHGPWIEPLLALAVLLALAIPSCDLVACAAALIVGVPFGLILEPQPELAEILIPPSPHSALPLKAIRPRGA